MHTRFSSEVDVEVDVKDTARAPVGRAVVALRGAKRRGAAAVLVLAGGVLALAGCTTPGTTAAACRTVVDCTVSSAPICDAQSLSCRACNPMQSSDEVACRNGHPGTPRCGPSGSCVACVANADCTDKILKPACKNFTCVPCQQASDCQSFICNADSTCAQVADVAFVNNKNGSCQGSSHLGTADDPFCSIQDAVDATMTAGKALISVAASSRAYDPVKINQPGIASTIYISGSSSDTGAVVIQGTNLDPALYVAAPPGKAVSVTVRNVDLVGSNLSSRSIVECEQKAELSLISSRVHDNAFNGLTSNDCKLTMDAVRIYATSTGLLVTGATYPYTISNLMSWSNRTSGIAFSGSNGSLRFATVYGNGSPTNDKPAGIDCGAGQNPIDYAIVFNNITNRMNGTSLTDLQLSGCKLNQVVTDDTKAIEAIYKQQIEFINAAGSPSMIDLRLKADSTFNRDCCIDKVTAVSGISHDVDFQKRPSPLGGAADIGAFEVQ